MTRTEKIKYLSLSVVALIVIMVAAYNGEAIDKATGAKLAPAPQKVQVIPDKTKARMSEYIQTKNITVYPALADTIAESILSVEEKYSIPRLVMLALVEVESGYNYAAVSDAGAIGLTQVHKTTWMDQTNPENLVKLGVIKKNSDLYDPVKNIKAGAFILNRYYTQAKNTDAPMRQALTRYYGGTNNDHYAKVCQRIGEFYVFNMLLNNQTQTIN